MRKLFIAIWALTCLFSNSFAQNQPQTGTAEVRGFLLDKDNGEPVLFTNVYLLGTKFGVATDVNGFFSITKIPPGDYTLVISSIGYDSVAESITLKAKQILTKRIEIRPRTVELEAVEIKGSKIARTTTVNAAVQQVTPKEIKIMPSIGGEPDLAQYLQTIPGVVFTGDQGGQLYIRGGAPIQNLVLMDGMVIYNPFHSIGLFSVFDTDILKNVDVYTGGFPSEFGGRTSAVLDVRTRDGNKKEFAGKFSANTFTSKLNLEGPISTSEDGSAITFLVSGRTSYLDKSSKIFYPYVNENGLDFSFNDLYAKVTTAGAGGSKLSVFGFRFDDKAALPQQSKFGWNSWGVGMNALLLPAGTSVIINTNFGYSQYDVGIIETTTSPRNSGVNGFNLGLDFTYFIKKNELKYGLQVFGNSTTFQASSPNGVRYDFTNNNTEAAAFFKYKIIKSRFIFEPAVRLHYYSSLAAMRLEPRIGAKYSINESVRLKIATGLFSQNLIATRSDRDVVNLFNGFISSPDNLSDANGNIVSDKLQRSIHLITGVEFDVGDYLELNVEPYIKTFDPLVNINPDRIFPSDAQFVIEKGQAIGIDFSGTYDKKNFYLFFSYSLARVNRTFNNKVYAVNFDRRHNINLVSSYKFGRKKDWELAFRWNFGSGFPFTKTVGFYQDYNFGGNPSANLPTLNGQLGIVYDELNKGRLPYYHRMDISIDKKIKISRKSTLELNAGIINVYNRNNIFYFDRVTFETVYQLPILPSLGMSWSF